MHKENSLMDRDLKRHLQDLLAHQAWAIFKGLALKVKEQVLVNLAASGRDGDGVRCAKFAGQLEMIDLMLKLPEQELKKK